MSAIIVADRHPIPPPSYTKSLARSLHLDALLIVERLYLLPLCQVAVTLAHRQCPPPPDPEAGHAVTRKPHCC